MIFCETELPSFVSRSKPDFRGATPDIELRYYQAVTGKKVPFAETIEIGRKIGNLERAICVAQGRHGDQEIFAPFMYMPGASFSTMSGGYPVCENGKWSWQPLLDMYLDRDGVELFKTNYYKFEGWDADSGWPTRKTLESVGFKRMADVLASRSKLSA